VKIGFQTLRWRRENDLKFAFLKKENERLRVDKRIEG